MLEHYFGFNQQFTEYECGPASLRHALLLCGSLISVKESRELTNSNQSGIWTANLHRAITACGHHYSFIREDDSNKAVTKLIFELNRGNPVILEVDFCSPHFICAIGHDNNSKKLVIADSRFKCPIKLWEYNDLIKRWRVSVKDSDATKFYNGSVVHQRKGIDLTKRIHLYVDALRKNDQVRSFWGEYLGLFKNDYFILAATTEEKKLGNKIVKESIEILTPSATDKKGLLMVSEAYRIGVKKCNIVKATSYLSGSLVKFFG